MSKTSRTSLSFNGVNAATGEYLLPDLNVDSIAAIVKGETLDPQLQKDLAFRAQQSSTSMFGVGAGIDANNLAETGWGVVFPSDIDQSVIEALQPLLNLRRQQASQRKEDRYREFSGVLGYRLGERPRDFLARQGVEASQPADPDRGVPYYLLLVGSPEQIPFRFQYQIDVQYAVGRVWFNSVDEFAQYAMSVVDAETGKISLKRKVAFFGVENEDDAATALSANEMVRPLSQQLPNLLSENEHEPWSVTTFIGEQATKSKLTELLGGPQTPALVFTASHGMGFPNGDTRQLQHQGALLCQDWPGPRKWRGAIPQDHYFAGEDLLAEAKPHGQIIINFACYGAGTPQMDDFSHLAYRQPVEIAPRPFIASLPQKLLGHSNGGALAVVGHVERAWGYSFYWDRIGKQLQTFEAALFEVMVGHRIGAALEYFDTRYAALATELSSELEEIKYGKDPDNLFLAGTWTAHNDARSYVILGDPAVKLQVDGASDARPTLQTSVDTKSQREHIPVQAEPNFNEQSPLLGKAANRPGSETQDASKSKFETAVTPVEGTDLGYYLIAYDEDGKERTDHPAGKISDTVLKTLTTEPITDVFLFSHGWRGDIPAAHDQYQRWVKTISDSEAGRQEIRKVRPGFQPLLIGIHWPSEPWGEESLDAVTFSPGSQDYAESIAEDFSRRLSLSGEPKAALTTIAQAATVAGDPETLPAEVVDAYRILDEHLALEKHGLTGAPGLDLEQFDPEAIYQRFRSDNPSVDSVSFGFSFRDTILAPLRVLSFWKMKDRARMVGESGVHNLLDTLKNASQGCDVRFHLVGHSFGCIVTSSAICGPPHASHGLTIDSLILLQGALSLWSFCDDVPGANGKPGYFHRLVEEQLVTRAFVTTQSRFDTAVGRWYPRAAGLAQQVSFEVPNHLPKYGSVGTFGVQGPGVATRNLKMLPTGERYDLAAGTAVNVDGSDYINEGGGISGAHSHLDSAELAQLFWASVSQR